MITEKSIVSKSTLPMALCLDGKPVIVYSFESGRYTSRSKSIWLASKSSYEDLLEIRGLIKGLVLPRFKDIDTVDLSHEIELMDNKLVTYEKKIQ